ncbi:hypothetical protein LJR289_005629 [Pseudoduganella sp. LjRoot289]|uniref:hypothetical protein n=1 Tax=Pseudoduganella sp. LjRoot289 TaxID=3342314 RepID=UPI003ECFBB4D
MSDSDNFAFTPSLIDSVAIRLGDGSSINVAIGTMQRMAALRSYVAFNDCKDWMEKLSCAYVVALATRSADQLLMQHIQDDLNGRMKISCVGCRRASIGHPLIRERLFPALKVAREHSNDLIHHLDDPTNKGVAELNIEGVFLYCHLLSQENIEALFGTIPDPANRFPRVICKNCSAKLKKSK